MEKFLSLVKSELQKKAWNSILQLCVGGVVLYFLSIMVGPAYGCGPDNAQFMENILNCQRGEMAPVIKAVVIAGILLASVCWGRAALLYERQSSDRRA